MDGMERSTKEPLLEEPPPRYSEAAPRPPPLPAVLAALLLAVLAVAVLVAFLLLGLHLAQEHAETVLRMSIPRDGFGEGPAQPLPMSPRGHSGTFAVKEGPNGSAVLVFDYGKLLVGYRSWRRRACLVTRVDGGGPTGLDAATQRFQSCQLAAAQPIADRSILGTTINILCSSVPIFWA